jgi:hypothetical protein
VRITRNSPESGLCSTDHRGTDRECRARARSRRRIPVTYAPSTMREMQATSTMRRQIYWAGMLARLVCWEMSIRLERFIERRERERVKTATRRRYHRAIAEREWGDRRNRPRRGRGCVWRG